MPPAGALALGLLLFFICKKRAQAVVLRPLGGPDFLLALTGRILGSELLGDDIGHLGPPWLSVLMLVQSLLQLPRVADVEQLGVTAELIDMPLDIHLFLLEIRRRPRSRRRAPPTPGDQAGGYLVGVTLSRYPILLLNTRSNLTRATAPSPALFCSHASLVYPGSGYSAFPPYCVVSACRRDRKSTRLNSSHVAISYAVFCLK